MPVRFQRNFFTVITRLVLTVFTIVVAMTSVQAWLNISSARQRNEKEEEKNLFSLYNDYQNEVNFLKEESAALANTIADRSDVQELLITRDRKTLQSDLFPIFNNLKANYEIVHLFFHLPNGYVFLRVHDPTNYGDSIANYRQTNIAALKNHSTEAGVELDPNRLGVSGVAPIIHNGEFIGIAEIGLDFDQAFIDGLKQRNQADYKIWISYDAAAPSGLWPKGNEPTAPSSQLFYYTGTSMEILPIATNVYDRVMLDQKPVTQFVTAGQQELAVLLAPLYGYGNQVLGILEISVFRTDALAALQRDQFNSFIISAGLTILALALMGLTVQRVVQRPLKHLTATAHRQIDGDLTARVKLSSQDEFGQLGITLNRLTEQLQVSIQNLERQVETIRQAEATAQHELAVRKWAEAALRENEEQLKLFVEYAPAAVAMFDRQMCYLVTSRRWIQDFHLENKTVIGQNYYDVFPEAPEHWKEIHNRCLAGIDKYVDEDSFRNVNGDLEWIRLEIHPWRTSEGNTGGLVMFNELITDRKKALELIQAQADELMAEKEELNAQNQELLEQDKELRQAEVVIRELNTELEQRVVERTTQLEAANLELEAFAYSVSHDLRAPLRRITGFSQVLAEDYMGVLDSQGKETLQRIQTTTRKMSDLIEALLKLSHVARSEMQLGEVNLSDIANEIAGELRATQPDRVVQFVIPENLVATADAKLMEVLLGNLLGNAWKFTGKHAAARIELGIVEQDDQRNYFVRDDGAGFDPSYASKLFGVFQRLHNLKDFEGTGIGLALTQRIVRRHGGRIWAEGQVEQGATFYFTLP
jgi:PAS domain S-box-containing protein